VVEALGGPIDVVHLGLGDDGHTASLAPGDPVLDVTDAAVAATAHPFNGTRRVTLTYPTINAARDIVWLLTGAGKVTMVPRLEAADPTIPAGRVEQARAVLVMDRAAAGGI
jgi:6-phosphogluconolactonase/glucosamine-6-phosphate isomerase/deaminase